MKKPTPTVAKDIKEIIKTLEAEKAVLLRIAEAKEKALTYIDMGYEVPGYYRAMKLGNRVFKKTATPEKLFSTFKKFFGNKKSNLYKPQEMKTAAQIEKFFIEDEAALEKFKKFTERPEKGYELKQEKN